MLRALWVTDADVTVGVDNILVCENPVSDDKVVDGLVDTFHGIAPAGFRIHFMQPANSLPAMMKTRLYASGQDFDYCRCTPVYSGNSFRKSSCEL